LLQALSGFHKFNIPHGNLTPENIIHMEEGIRLTDPMPPCYNALLGITDIDLFRRLRYGPPETAMGFPVDCRGDLYRVGIFLYIKITGDHPFAAYDPILEGQRHVSMIPPSLLDYQPEISPCLAGLIHRFLAKDPDERPESSLVALEILRNQIILPTLEEAPFQERQDEATAKPSPFMAQVVSVILILVTFAVLVLLLESFRWDFLH
jgi:serine/threonine-protein kinase